MKKVLLIILIFISFVGFSQTPGGVATTNMSLWLSGDSNVTDSGTLSWGDKSGVGFDAFQDTAANKPTQTNLFNFNQTFTFDGVNDYLAIESKNYVNASSISDLYAFVVYKSEFSGGTNDNWAFIDFDRSESYNFYITGGGVLAMSYNTLGGTENDLYAGTNSNNNRPHIGTFIFDNSNTNESQMRLDGYLDYSGDDTASDISVTSNRYGFIGDGSEASSEDGSRNENYFDGDIAEVILFDQGSITATEVLKIESYLALKYGITLDVSNTNYLDSNGNVIWNNTTYWNNIAGLIKDNVTGNLNQRIAKSETSDLIVSIDSDDYTSANNSRVTSLTNDGDYLLFGNNGESGMELFSGSDNILKSKWLFKEGVNNTGTVSLAMPINVFPEGTTISLIRSTDDTFDGTDTTVLSTTSSDGDFYYWDVDIANNERISFLVSDIKVAGVSVTRFDMMLRADKNLTTSGTLNWTDGSYNNADGYQASSSSIPSSSSYMNFNPTLTFDGANDYIAIKNKHYDASDVITDMHAFTVFSTSFSDDAYNSNWSFIDFDRSESYNMYIHGDGRLAFSYQSSGTKDLFSASLGNDGLPHIAEFIFDASLVDETFMKFDGNIEYNENLTTGNIVVKQNRYGFIGDGSESSSENSTRNNIYFDGQIAEVILADRESFTAAETLQLESYLGLKYGITIHNSLLTYKNSAGTTIWDNSTYWNGIAGLIKDNDDSDLDQRVAQSTSSLDIIVATDLDFTSGNLDHGNRSTSLTEGSSLIFGNNGSGVGFVEHDVASEYITARKWLFKEVGTDSGTIHIAILKSFFPEDATGVELLVSTDDTFTDAVDTHITLTDDGTYYHASLNIADGDRIAYIFGLPNVPSPGNVSDGLMMWIKANQNVTSSTNIVTSIGDSSTGGNDVSQSTNLDKPRDDEFINFNTTLNFDGTSDHLAVQNLNFTTTGEIDRMYSWVVYETDYSGANNGSLLSFDDDEYFDVSVKGDGALGFSYTTSAGTTNNSGGTTGTNNGTSNLGGFIYNTTDLTNETVIRLNGTEDFSGDVDNNDLGGAGNTRFGYIGDGSTATTFDGGNSGDFYEGKISEVIFYKDVEVDATEISKIESYLAVKYGITKAGNYIDSDGTTIWDATANSTYHHNIMGIGRDDKSELNQKQSTSTGGNSFLTVSLAGAIATDNNDITESFDDDLDFLVIGDNSSDNTLSLENYGVVSGGTCSEVYKSLDRDWKVSNVGSVANVTLSFDLSTVPIPAVGYSLDIDTDGDGDFTTGSITTETGTLTGTTLVFTGVTLADGVVFTLRTTEQVSIVIYDNGIWSGGDGPDEELTNSDLNESVFMYDDYTFTDDIDCTCLTSSSGVELTVSESKILTVSNILDNNGSIFLYDNAQLVQIATETNLGTGNIYQIIDELTDSGYRFNYVSSPVNTGGTFTLSGNLKFNTNALDIEANTNPSFINNDSDGFGTTLSSNWFYTLNSAGTYTKIDENTALLPGVGFTMKGTNQSNRYNFIGVPNNGNINALTIVSDEYAIVGNPYPSAIDGDVFSTDMFNAGVTDGIIYLWDQPSGSSHYQDQYDGGYATRTKDGVAVPASFITGGTSASTPSNVIKPGQGFSIVGGASGGVVQFTNSMRLTDTDVSGEKFFKTSDVKLLKPIIRLGFEFDSNKGRYHRQLATTPSGGTLSYDAGQDAMMFDDYNNDAYWLIDDKDEKYVITSVPFVSEDLSLPVGVDLNEDKQVTFMLDGTESFTNDIYLLDKEQGIITNIREDNYEVIVSKGTTVDRFSLVFKSDQTLDSDYIDANSKTVIYVDENYVNIVLEDGIVQEVELYDLTGKKILHEINSSKTNQLKVNKQEVKNQFVVLKILTSYGIITQKIYL